MESEEEKILKFDGTPFENKNITISFPPDLAFKLDVLAAKECVSTEKYILKILAEHVDDNFSNKKKIFGLFE